MKKLITILCAVLITIGLSAQTDQGGMYLGVYSGGGLTGAVPPGSGAGFSSSSSPDCDDCDALTELNFNIDGGYFVIDNLMITATLGMASYKQGDSDGGTTTFGIGARYYINGIYPMLGYYSMKEKDADEGISILRFGAGYAVMLNDNVAFEPSLSYGMWSSDGEDILNRLAIGLGFGIHF